jgi:hypothetical protein
MYFVCELEKDRNYSAAVAEALVQLTEQQCSTEV